MKILPSDVLERLISLLIFTVLVANGKDSGL